MLLKHSFWLLETILKQLEVVVVDIAVAIIVILAIVPEGIADHRSYIEYECDKALRDGLKIIVLYNAASVNKAKCPDSLRNVGTHTAMCYYYKGNYYWDYLAVKTALS